MNSYFGWINSKGFNGFGTYTFKIGASFKGTFEESLSEGLGCLTYINGDIYKGEFLAGRPHGYGHYKSEHFKYIGCFQNGKFHGKGILKTRTKEFEGLFCVGRIESGESRDCSGVFNGVFEKLGLRRKGKFTFKNGNTYNGFWTYNTFSGFGEYNWTTGKHLSPKEDTKYVGYWWNGKRDGLGFLTFNQRFVICQWSRGKKSGAGIIIACNGSCYSSNDLFIDDQYKESQCIRNCQESQKIVSEAMNILSKNSKYESLDDKINAFLNIVRELEQYSIFPSAINPIRIHSYEIPRESFSLSLESKHLQQVLVENLAAFKTLYKKYSNPSDEFLNGLGLNLFYIDIFHKVRDISISKCLKTGRLKISHIRIYSDDRRSNNIMSVVPFYEFFQHIVHITEVLMENKELKTIADKIKPTFFGHLAARVLLVLRMLETNETALLFLVSEGISLNLPRISKLLKLLQEILYGEMSIKTAYTYLKVKGVVNGRSIEFLNAVEMFYNVENNISTVLFHNNELSDMELIEIIFHTCQNKLTRNID